MNDETPFGLVDMQQMGDNASLALVIGEMLKAQRARTLQDMRALLHKCEVSAEWPISNIYQSLCGMLEDSMYDLGIDTD